MEESNITPVALPPGVEAVTLADEPTWLEARRLGIGASESAAILGLSRFKTPIQLYYEKLGLAARGPAEEEAAEWGKILEGPIAQRYAQATKRPVETPPPYTILRRDSLPVATATLDRLVQIEQVWAPLELKTAHFVLAKNWKEEVPLEYMVQVQHQMMIWGAPLASIAALIGGSTFLYTDVEADAEFQQMLYAVLAAFWKRLEDQNPPPMDGTAGTHEMLKKLYATESGAVIALPSEAMDWDEEIAKLKAEIKERNEALTLHENQMIAAIGNASAGVLPNGTVWTHKSQSRKEYTTKASTYRVLRRHGAKETR